MHDTLTVQAPPAVHPELLIRESVERIVTNVFGTMLDLPAVARHESPPPAGASPSSPLTADLLPSPPPRITGAVGIGGETIRGAIYLHFPEPLAREAASAMLGTPAAESVRDPDINDVVGELCNMVAGGMKALLCDSGVPCAISAPAVIRGGEYAIEAADGSITEQFCFDCRTHRLAVEVHLQLN